MNSQTLREARIFEEVEEKTISSSEKPLFHLCARSGWMNDPNGFSFYKGEYHLFYQYYPYAPHWDSMHWGHAVTKDFLHWSYLPAVLAPDQLYDKDGCFSGNAVELPDGRQLLMYTGVVHEPQAGGSVKDVQTQCLAVGDGLDYEKYELNPVLTEKDIPDEGSRHDFRDPKIWQEKDGTYTCALVNRGEDGNGRVLLYKSRDAFHWTFDKVLVRNDGRYGTMWECPDFFELNGKWVLLTSPMDMLPKGFEYHNGNGSLCLIGEMDPQTGTFCEEHDQAIDYGIDFYAAQTVLAEDGRRIMVAWMQNWDTCDLHMQKPRWCGQMTIPRELSVRDGRLYQRPVRELEALRCEEVICENVLVEGKTELEGVRGRTVELELEVSSADEEAYQKFSVYFAENSEYHSKISYHPQEQILKIDRKFSGSRRAVIHQRRALVRTPGRVLRMRIILDRFSVEVFINGGEQTMTATYFTDLAAEGISFEADGRAVMNLKKWTLRP